MQNIINYLMMLMLSIVSSKKKCILFCISNLVIVNLFAQVPNTDIWLLAIKIENEKVLFINPENITNRSGYDNQPAFSSDGKYILYSSIRDDKQSDIYKYDIKTKIISQFTKTATSEYSPTFLADNENISLVMVEPDSVQRLWKFALNGGTANLIMKEIDSVAYHCWLDNNHVALFLITNPMKLIFADITTGKSIVVTDTIGRSMHCVKNKNALHFFYLYKEAICSADVSSINTMMQNSFEHVDKDANVVHYINTETQTTMKFKGEDFCVLNNDSILVGNGPKLFLNYSNSMDNREPDFEWKEIADLSKYGITNITRIAVSHDNSRLAIVAESK